MIQRGRVRRVMPVASGRVLLHRGGRRPVSDGRAELEWVEQEIEHTTEAARKLVDELGARYAVFRCGIKRYEDGRTALNADIMRLSKQADECIRTIYDLEHRRKELLQAIGR